MVTMTGCRLPGTTIKPTFHSPLKSATGGLYHHHTAQGWGSRPLVFLARYLAGRPRGR